MGYKVAVVGATGNVGRELLNTLDERDPAARTVISATNCYGSSSAGVRSSVTLRTDDVPFAECTQ